MLICKPKNNRHKNLKLLVKTYLLDVKLFFLDNLMLTKLYNHVCYSFNK